MHHALLVTPTLDHTAPLTAVVPLPASSAATSAPVPTMMRRGPIKSLNQEQRMPQKHTGKGTYGPVRVACSCMDTCTRACSDVVLQHTCSLSWVPDTAAHLSSRLVATRKQPGSSRKHMAAYCSRVKSKEGSQPSTTHPMLASSCWRAGTGRGHGRGWGDNFMGAKTTRQLTPAAGFEAVVRCAQ